MLPLISILIPCYNEENFILDCLDSVFNNDYPKDKIEIFIIDGMSTDNTIAIVNKLIKERTDYNINLIRNYKKYFPCALNIGIEKSSGEFIFVLGAHAKYKIDYFSLCVKTATTYNADNTGGVLNTIGLNKSYLGRSINNVLSCSFGVGNSIFRTGAKKTQEVDTVFGGCYKRSVFYSIGKFNENLISTSDMDFNIRLKKNGGKIILNPSIIITYYTRNNLKTYIKNNLRNGYWAIYPLRYVSYLPVTIRHLIPLLFVSGIIGGIVLSIFSKWIMFFFLLVLGLYFLLALFFSFYFIQKGLYNIFIMPFIFLITHITYGIGSLWAFIRVLFYKFFKPNINETAI